MKITIEQAERIAQKFYRDQNHWIFVHGTVELMQAINDVLAAGELPTAPPEGHVRVRLAVAVADNGSSIPYWAGWLDPADDQLKLDRWASSRPADERVSLVVADLPKPAAPSEVVGRVVE